MSAEPKMAYVVVEVDWDFAEIHAVFDSLDAAKTWCEANPLDEAGMPKKWTPVAETLPTRSWHRGRWTIEEHRVNDPEEFEL